MPDQPTDKIPWRLVRHVNITSTDDLDAFEKYASGELAVLPKYYDGNGDCIHDFSQYSKEDIKAVVESERVFRETTLDEWLEMARDFYQDSTGTKRRPKLLEDEFITFLRLNEKYGADDKWFRPEQFLNAVWVLGKDTTIDHTTFETLPYYSEVEGALTWISYQSKSYEQFRIYHRPTDTAGFIDFDVDRVP